MFSETLKQPTFESLDDNEFFFLFCKIDILYVPNTKPTGNWKRSAKLFFFQYTSLQDFSQHALFWTYNNTLI